MLGIAASEPIAAVGHPPAKDADGNGGQQRPQDGQREVRNQPERNKGSPEDLALHFLILPPAEALSPSEKRKCFDENHMPSAQQYRLPHTIDRMRGMDRFSGNGRRNF